MTQDDIIQMARQAKATEIGHKPPAFHFYLKDLEEFVRLILVKEKDSLLACTYCGQLIIKENT